jgi:hypothetical protein
MGLPVNGERGEVALRIGSTDLVIAATMGGLAALSTALECRSLVELYQRVFGSEPRAMVEVVRCLAVKGDAEAAVSDVCLGDFPAIRAAAEAALMHSITARDPKPKGERKPGKATSLRDWCRVAFGALKWRPSVFWRSTLTEVSDAIDGLADTLPGKSAAGPSQDEVTQLVKRYG